MSITGYTRTRYTLFACLLLAGPALAEERVVREHRFDLANITDVEFHASVGTLRILPASGREMSLVLEIEGKDGGWFQKQRDVSGIDLESRVRGSRLILEQTEDDTETQWTVRMPAVDQVDIRMGVGQIDAEFGPTTVRVKLGVGDIDLVVPEATAGHVDLSVGVGEARLRGIRATGDKRAFVSHTVRGEGNGSHDVQVDNGVGEITVRAL